MSDLPLDAIRAAPDDDGPRLEYAVAVEASDPARAEFIRLQLRLHGMPQWHPEWYAADSRACRLLWENRGRWLHDAPLSPGVEWHFERGFADIVAVSTRKAMPRDARAFLALGSRRLQVMCWRSPGALASCPALAAVRDLHVEATGLTDDAVAAVLASPHLGPLVRLELVFRELSDATLIALAGCERLAGLRDLRLWATLHHETRFTARGVEALAASPHLRALRTLKLTDCGLDDSARALWRSPVATGLHALNLGGNALTAAGLAGLPRVRRLELANNRIDDIGTVSRLAGLAWLDLSSNALNDAAAQTLAAAPTLRSLHALNVAGNLIDDGGMRALGRSRTLSGLRVLRAHGNPAGAALTDAVSGRFRDGGPPPEDAPSSPAPVADVATVGTADEDGLVRALVIDPADAVARAVYADWLEEHGAADLAAWLRLEREAPGSGRLEREKGLVRRLTDVIQGVSLWHVFDIDFGQRLPTVTVPLRQALTKTFGAVARRWREECHVHGLRLTGRVADPKRLAGIDALAHVRRLSLYGLGLGDDRVAALAASEHVGGLLDLDLHGNRLFPAGMIALFGRGRLGRLCALNLGGNSPGTDGLRALCESPAAAGLARLSLFSTYTSRSGVAVLAASPHLRWLRELNLARNDLGDDAVRVLAESVHLPALESLNLASNPITAAGAAALIGSAVLARLCSLTLPEGVGDIRPLARALPDSCRLVLSRYNTPEEVRAEVSEILGGRARWT